MAFIFTKKYAPSPKNTPPKKEKKTRPKWLKPLLWTLGILFILGLLGIVGIFAYYAKDLPEPGKVNARNITESTKIFDRTGEHLLYEIHGEEKRTLISFNDMPANIKYATLALEDRDFYSHHGIKFSSIARAALKDIIKQSHAQGGSTITQQFVKNSLLTREKTYTRKIKEVILSLEMEQVFTKNEILEMYLNEIPYGSNAYGIESASQTFFNKPAKDLSLDESALLASLPNAPTFYSPFGNNVDALKRRQHMALQAMADLGYISQEEADQAKNEDTLAKIDPRIDNIQAPHFVMYVREYLENKYGQEMAETEGLKVYTTLDFEKQQIAERVVREQVEKNQKTYDAENGALVAINPKTGEILAMVGSRNFFDKEIDGQVNVALSDRQPGSSIKPLVYLAGLTKGYTPDTILFDVETNFNSLDGTDQEYKPQNYDGSFRGPVKLKEALAQSLNIPAVKMLYLAGLKDSIALAKSLGITTLNDPERYGLSLVLGGGEVKLLDHVSAYATIANNGVRNDKTSILRIEDSEGNILEKFDGSTSGTRVVEEKFISALDYILSTNEFRAPVFGENNRLAFKDRPVAAKTGTTNEFRDGWTVGYTPNLAVGVWVGNNNNRPMKPGADGSIVAAPIWRAFMDEALKNMPKEEFPEYKEEDFKTDKDILDGELRFEEDVKVCEIPGEDDKYCKANKYCPESEVKKKDFADVNTILYFVDKNDPQGDKPKDPKSDPQFKEWEKGVENYYKKNKDFLFGGYPEDECKESDFSKYKPSISLSIDTSGREVSLSASVDAPYGVDWVKFYVNGKEIYSDDSEKPKKVYTASDDENNSTLSIRAEIRDENGNMDEETKSASVSFSEPEM